MRRPVSLAQDVQAQGKTPGAGLVSYSSFHASVFNCAAKSQTLVSSICSVASAVRSDIPLG